jgi:phosphoglycerate kinase
MRYISEIQDLKGKKVFLRCDLNVPFFEGKISDFSRIEASLKTINFLLEKGAAIIICSHLGRPKGEVKEELRLKKVQKALEERIGKKVNYLQETISPKVLDFTSNMNGGEILLLENIRFEKGEKKGEEELTETLSKLADIYVNDAFGAAHRKHVSTYYLAEKLPSYAGLLIEKEIKALSPLLKGDFRKPLTLIFGGAKIDTKIGVIKQYLGKADHFIIGGGLANTFLKAQGYEIGKSLKEDDQLETALEILNKAKDLGTEIHLPTDVITGVEISNEATEKIKELNQITESEMILDMGPKTTEKFTKVIKNSQTVIWNGPVGLYEFEQFSQGSFALAKAIAESTVESYVGGGDSADCIKKSGVNTERFTHISTGGGATIEYLSGKTLPALEVLS